MKESAHYCNIVKIIQSDKTEACYKYSLSLSVLEH